MGDEDYEDLIRLVFGLLAENGLSEIAADSNYIDDEGDGDGPPRMMEPKEHLLALLEAFDTHLMLNDSSAAHRSLRSISRVCLEGGPTSAIVLTPSRGDVPETTSLLDLPDLSSLRKEVRQLSDQIRETPRDEPSAAD